LPHCPLGRIKSKSPEKKSGKEEKMEKWRVHKLIDTNEETGEKSQIGGGIVRMQIGAVNGSLHTIDVSPVSVEEMKEESWEDQFVRFQVADRVVWMEPEEVQILIDLLRLAKDVSLENYEKARP